MNIFQSWPLKRVWLLKVKNSYYFHVILDLFISSHKLCTGNEVVSHTTTARKARRLETETRGIGHSEEKKDETKTRKAEHETDRGIRERSHFDENTE